MRYLAIPTEVRLGLKERAMREAASLSSDLRTKGYAAVAVASAEEKDMPGVAAAIEKMRSTLPAGPEDRNLSEVDVMLTTLNVTAALIGIGAFEEATRLLTAVEESLDDISKMSIERHVQLQRVVVLAQQSKFDEGRSLALRISSNSEDDRGAALRIVALLETKMKGIASARLWASALAGAADRAYALLGISQAALGIGKTSLPYAAIQIH